MRLVNPDADESKDQDDDNSDNDKEDDTPQVKMPPPIFKGIPRE